MSDNRIISGTPWHTERVHRAEGDERRHKSRCYYYLDDDNHCRYSHTHCIGSAHCNYYKAISDDEFKQR